MIADLLLTAAIVCLSLALFPTIYALRRLATCYEDLDCRHRSASSAHTAHITAYAESLRKTWADYQLANEKEARDNARAIEDLEAKTQENLRAIVETIAQLQEADNPQPTRRRAPKPAKQARRRTAKPASKK